MSDSTYTEPTPDEQDGDEDFKNLRAKARKADQLERENQQLTRKVAFIEAGIPTTDPRLAYFVKGYDGELEPDAIRTAAIEAGFIAVTQEPDPVAQQAQDGQRRVMEASAGAESSDDLTGISYGMQTALAEGGIDGLSAYAEQYGVTFNSPSL
jgi:hypothetical protein